MRDKIILEKLSHFTEGKTGTWWRKKSLSKETLQISDCPGVEHKFAEFELLPSVSAITIFFSHEFD